jgi:hypothetical protein
MLLPTIKMQLLTTHDSHVQRQKPPKEETYLYKGEHKGVSWPAGVWWENKRLAKWKVRHWADTLLCVGDSAHIARRATHCMRRMLLCGC